MFNRGHLLVRNMANKKPCKFEAEFLAMTEDEIADMIDEWHRDQTE